MNSSYTALSYTGLADAQFIIGSKIFWDTRIYVCNEYLKLHGFLVSVPSPYYVSQDARILSNTIFFWSQKTCISRHYSYKNILGIYKISLYWVKVHNVQFFSIVLIIKSAFEKCYVLGFERWDCVYGDFDQLSFQAVVIFVMNSTLTVQI